MQDKPSFEVNASGWASVVINALLIAMQQATDIPKGFAIDGIAINEGKGKGTVNVVFVFKEVRE